MNSNATRCPPFQTRQIPQGFFEGVQNGAHSSAARSTRSSQHPHRTLVPLLERFSSLFHHSRSETNGVIELQQRPMQSIFSHRSPRIVEVTVPTVQDRKALYVAPPKQKTRQRAQSHSHGSCMTVPASGTNTTPPGARPANSRLVRLLAHLVLFLCCASPEHTGGNAPQQL
ncbi:hypothetical protein BDR04DRAFT_466352 [Suillus decipiens]|nr:hypothetical protein BDR04DRAFT_466352 [Suillus decipiens]